MRDMARILYNILCDVPMVEDIQYIGNAAYINLEDGDILKISLNSSNENHVFDKIKLRLIKRDWGTLDICYLEFKEYFSPVRIGKDYFLSPAVKKMIKDICGMFFLMRMKWIFLLKIFFHISAHSSKEDIE